MAKQAERESFTFYKSFELGIQRLDDNEQLQVYRAISQYSLFGIIPDLSGYAGMAWELIKPILEKARKGFENGIKGAEYGYLGGAPKGNQNARKQPQNNPQNNPTYTDTDTKERVKKVAQKMRFTPPTIEQVREYINQNNYDYVDAEAFFNYYETNGWMAGRNPMKKWQSAVGMWQAREKKKPQQTPQQTPTPKIVG